MKSKVHFQGGVIIIKDFITIDKIVRLRLIGFLNLEYLQNNALC